MFKCEQCGGRSMYSKKECITKVKSDNSQNSRKVDEKWIIGNGTGTSRERKGGLVILSLLLAVMGM